MSYRFVIDSYAWIEYFKGTDAGRLAKNYRGQRSCDIWDNSGRT